MKSFIKKIVLLGILGGVIYILLSYHFIVIGKSVKMLRKASYTMDYIFFSTKAKRAETILKIEPLWKAGIGELLVEEGLMSEEELDLYKETRGEG